MAARLIWSDDALDDTDALGEYISRNSPYHARRIVQEIFAISESLIEHPRMGLIVPELNDETIRERFVYSYRIIYEIRSNEVEILAVIHGRRLLESIEDRLT